MRATSRQEHDWRGSLGMVEGRPVVLIHPAGEDSPDVQYFVRITWRGASIATIRDFRYARYVMRDAEVSTD